MPVPYRTAWTAALRLTVPALACFTTAVLASGWLAAVAWAGFFVATLTLLGRGLVEQWRGAQDLAPATAVDDHPADHAWWQHAARHAAAGGQGRVWVLDLPAAQQPRVLARLLALPGLEVSPDERPQPPRGPARERRHALRCRGPGDAPLLILVLATPQAFDVAFGFGAAWFGPEGGTADEQRQRRRWLVDLAEDCRRGVSGARCVLTTSPHDDPRAWLEGADAVVW
jgi:hypothetical protein